MISALRPVIMEFDIVDCPKIFKPPSIEFNVKLVSSYFHRNFKLPSSIHCSFLSHVAEITITCLTEGYVSLTNFHILIVIGIRNPVPVFLLDTNNHLQVRKMSGLPSAGKCPCCNK